MSLMHACLHACLHATCKGPLALLLQTMHGTTMLWACLPRGVGGMYGNAAAMDMLRSYHPEKNPSHQNWEFNLDWAPSVLG